MPGPGYKRGDLPGPSRAKNYKPKKRRKDRRHLNRQSRRATIRAARRSAQAGLRAANRAAAAAESQSTRAVTNYAAGTKTNLPTLQQLRTVWPTLSESERASIAPKIVSRAFSEASSTPGPKKPLPNFLRKYAPKKFDQLAELSGYKAPGEPAQAKGQKALKELQVDTVGEAVDLGLTLLPVGGIAGKAVKGAFDAAKAGKAARAVEEGAEAVVKGGSKGKAAGASTRVAEGTAKQGSRIGRVTKAGKGGGAGSSAVKTGGGSSRLGNAARAARESKLGRGAAVTAKVGSAPIRKPITRGYPLYLGGAGAVAAVSGENVPDAVKSAAALNPTGKAKEIVNAVGDELEDYGVLGNAIKDTLELPAAVVPSTYLLGKAAVESIAGEKVQGPDGEMHSPIDIMWDQYVEKGALPAIVKGDWKQLETALKEHPVFSGLEFYGAGAGASRATGAALRAAPSKRLRQAGSTERKPLRLADKEHEVRREYGKGVVKKGAGVLRDRRRAKRMGGQKASVAESNRLLAGGKVKSGIADRTVGKGNLVVRAGRAEEMEAVQAALPKGRGKAAQANRNGVNLVVNYGVPRGDFIGGLQRLRTKALAKREELIARSRDKSLPKDERSQAKMELRTNEEFVKIIEDVIKRGNPDEILASAIEIGPRLRQLQDDLVDAGVGLTREQAEKATLIPAARLHLDAGYGKPVEQVAARKAWRQAKRRGEDVGEKPKVREQVLDAEGRALSTDQIKAGLRELGINPDEIGFVSMRPGAGGRGDFYQPWFPTEQGIGAKVRTGEAAIRGWDATADSLIGQMVRSRGIVDNARTFRNAIMEFASKGPNGKVRTVKANRINAVKAELEARTGMRWQAVKINPRRAEKSLEEVTDMTPDDMSSMLQLTEQWVAAKQGGPGDYVMIPDAVFKRFNQHFNHAGTFRQSMQMINQAFKGTVLPYSPKWLLSNVVDVNMRAMIAGQPPLQRIFSLNRRFALDIVGRGKQIDPKAGGDAAALFEAGTHYGSQSTTRYFGRLENLAETSRLGQAILRLRTRPSVDRAVRAHQVTRDWVFNLNRNLVENPGQLAILGKQLRQEAIRKGYIKRWEGVWKLDDAARNDLAKGLLQTENQVRYAQGIERVFGQWGSNSPAMREFLVDYAPFGMWTRAATKFVFHTLPADHPVLVGIIAATEQMTQEEREKLGLSIFSDRPLPENLRAGLPLPGGGIIGGVSGMTSYGFFADPANAVSQTIMPQFSGSLDALAGLDWTGKRLLHEDGTPLSQAELAWVAFKEGAETFLPPLAVIDRAKTIAGGDNPLDATRDLLLGKDLEQGIAEWLRDKEAYGVGEYTNSGPSSSSDSSSSSSSDSSSSGSSLPPWYGGSSSSSSSGGTSLPPWYGGQ